MSKHHVLAIKKYNFADEKSGREVSGCKVTYLGDEVAATPTFRGRPALTITCDEAFYDSFAGTPVPGNYELEFAMLPGAGGKPQLQLKKATHLPDQR